MERENDWPVSVGGPPRCHLIIVYSSYMSKSLMIYVAPIDEVYSEKHLLRLRFQCSLS